MYSQGSYTAWSKRTHWLLLASSGRTTKWELSVEHQINDGRTKGKKKKMLGGKVTHHPGTQSLGNSLIILRLILCR